MSPLKLGARAAVLGLAALSLSACVTVFPKTKPAQTYRFDGAVAADKGKAKDEAPAPAGGPKFAVLRAGGSFNRAASSDRLLAVNGEKTEYVAEARWISPAISLFDEALAKAYDANTGPARLITRGEAAKADYSLRVDVRSFEARYDHGPKAPPLVVVALRASLTRPDRTLVGQEMFESQVRAGDNRVSEIVQAYGLATGEVLAKLVAFTNQAPIPPPSV
jgi:cholesterol transport system auxiliary component